MSIEGQIPLGGNIEDDSAIVFLPGKDPSMGESPHRLVQLGDRILRLREKFFSDIGHVLSIEWSGDPYHTQRSVIDPEAALSDDEQRHKETIRRALKGTAATLLIGGAAVGVAVVIRAHRRNNESE